MRRIVILVLALTFICVTAGLAQDHAYIGVKRCSMCHKGEAKGMIFEKWSEGPHAKAYTALAGEAAMQVYTDLSKEGNPQEDPECLKCHVAGYGEAAEVTAKVVMDEGVTCEACHGAGGDYWKKTIMEDREAAIANGMNADPKAQCTKCHNEESPTYKPFNVDERWAQISHSRQ